MAQQMELSLEQINERSLLMRMFHCRFEGEAFYHANLVNGAAEGLLARGWIEAHGDGYRLTRLGEYEWALLNKDIIYHKYNSNGALAHEIGRILTEGLDMKTICLNEGCNRPRMVSKNGKTLQRCELHQREYWNEIKAKQNAEKKAEEEAAGVIRNRPGRPAAQKSADAAEDEHAVFLATVAALPDRPRLIDTYTPPETTNHWVDAPLPDGYAELCGDCVYKDVIELLEKRGVPGVKEIIEGVKALRK